MITPSGVFVGAAAIAGPRVASVSLLSAIRAGRSSDDWAEAVRFGGAPEGGVSNDVWSLFDAGAPDPFERAIAAWKKKGVVPNNIWSLLEPFFKAQSFSLAGQWNTDFLEELLTSLSKALFDGGTVKDWLKDADAIFGKFGAAKNRPRLFDGPVPKAHYADMVFRTNQSTYTAAGTYAETFSRKWIARAPYWLYSAISDDRTREEHEALDGKVFRKDDAKARRLLPPNSWNCFPGDAAVSGRFAAGFKAWYDGEMVELVTRRGHRLTVTRNHPVLTPGGFVLAHDVQEGDRLVCHEVGGEDRLDAPRAHEAVSRVPGTNQRPLLRGDDHVQDRPASIEELFESLRLMGGLHVAPSRPEDFYGDALFGVGKIEVVATSRELLDRLCASRAESVSDLGFPLVDEQHAAVPSLGSLDESIEGRFPAPDGAPRRGALALDGGAIGLERGPLHTLCLALPAEGDAGLGKSSPERTSGEAALVGQRLQGLAAGVPLGDPREAGDLGAAPTASDDESLATGTTLDAAGVEDLPDSKERNVQGAAQREGGLPGEVTTDDVVLVKRFAFRGHVFDLQSPYGWILSGGIFTSNCRCQSIELDADDVKDGGYRVTSGSDIPAENFPPEGWNTDRVAALVPSFLQGVDLDPKEHVN